MFKKMLKESLIWCLSTLVYFVGYLCLDAWILSDGYAWTDIFILSGILLILVPANIFWNNFFKELFS